MTITVKNLYKIGNAHYQMRLLAGHNGMNNLVQWLHIVEDQVVCQFLHGQEAVITTGIANDGKNNYWLLEFAKALHQAGTSAFILNIGPYIPSVPNEVIAFCESINLPLFVVPWSVHLVDMTRDFCYRIMQSETLKDNLVTTIKNILFNSGDITADLLQMERCGFAQDDTYCFLCLSLPYTDEVRHEELMVKLEWYAEKMARSISDLYISFTYNDYLILMLTHFTNDQVHLFVKQYYALICKEHSLSTLHMGISTNNPRLSAQRQYFNEALSAHQMTYRKNEPILFYEELDIYKLLLAVNNKDLLLDYYNEIIGKLTDYDAANKTSFIPFLKSYLSNNGSPQAVAEQQFIHRNTVNNTLKKIEKITGYNLLDLDTKLKCTLGFYIQALL